jgi:hypothetical protein
VSGLPLTLTPTPALPRGRRERWGAGGVMGFEAQSDSKRTLALASAGFRIGFRAGVSHRSDPTRRASLTRFPRTPPHPSLPSRGGPGWGETGSAKSYAPIRTGQPSQAGGAS